ncbi:UNVERIFIED_CONTAM: hypothetical protein GTU68_062296 [Idotea baltica]|nr:hypothetical protein [Idotea baltica]
MAFFTATNMADFKQQLQTELAQYVPPHDLPQIALFSEYFFSISPLDELMQKRLPDLAGYTFAAWSSLHCFNTLTPKICVFSPTSEKNHWQSHRTVIEFLHADSPFLVDSLRMELNRHGYNIHTLQNTIIQVERDSTGKLTQIHPKGSTNKDARKESLIFVEIDQHLSTSERKSLEQNLYDIFSDVHLCTSDFSSMRNKLNELITSIDAPHPFTKKAEHDEVKAFLKWLSAEHFTFLGYEEFTVSNIDKQDYLTYDINSLLGISKRLRGEAQPTDILLNHDELSYLNTPYLISFAKAAMPSRVHRPAYPDLVSLRQIDENGKVTKEHRFIGLYTSSVYNSSIKNIPYIRHKANVVKQKAEFEPNSYLDREFSQILEILPRDDLFQTPVNDLLNTAVSIIQIQERNKIRLFLRRGPYGLFYYCLVYVPRDIYSTKTRLKIQKVLSERLNANGCEFWTYFSESVLTRVQFILHVDPKNKAQINVELLEQEIIQACRSWDDDYSDLTIKTLGESKGSGILTTFPNGFPAGYHERFTANSGLSDIQHLMSLTDEAPLVMNFYQPLTDDNLLHCKLYHKNTPLPLSDVLPILENLGLRVIGEFPYLLKDKEGDNFWIHDFSFAYTEEIDIDITQLNNTLQSAFINVFNKHAANDAFNRLVLLNSMPWREVALLRAYARYQKQIYPGFSLDYIAQALVTHANIAKLLTELFKTRFCVARKSTINDLIAEQKKQEEEINNALEHVEVLNEDRILRRYLALIKATLRTNFYQPTSNNQDKSYFSFKLAPHSIPDMPKPVPMFEVFIYSPRVEGVHLRGGKVARGGLRWSDRAEDFRTEILGLVKAQQVKNAVIVPVGAKGGFVPKCLPQNGSRDEIQAEAIECYRIFIKGLLDITDNLKYGEIIPPQNVIRYDEDDPYLVVAADKGTATFSDIANSLAEDYNFWLGDAFASGGSAGYDHKKMGITAKGAWVAVQRHFREKDIDIQKDVTTVIGIGDMAGDVFGNGLLLSKTLQLVAAFNHLHIFIDPNPDVTKSFAERSRLFDLPRSNWTDYNTSLISKGGGIFSRNAKTITISPEMKQRFKISANQLAPMDLLKSLLKAPVDLLWNGGIGTYVKASSETHADVGDKSNDLLRINGNELKAQVVGEGGNLGMTQLGRIEYCLNGGASNTDFIDNAAGVDCSDHEVNIKILLNEMVLADDMTVKQRNKLLSDMTDTISGLVLDNNYKQDQALSLAVRDARNHLDDYTSFIHSMESDGKLDRVLEFLPSDEELNERLMSKAGLSRPELSVLISYSKINLKESLLKSNVLENDYLAQEIETAFPKELVNKFKPAINKHQLKNEIISTQIANDIVNHMGITFVQRLKESTGATSAEISLAYVTVRDLFDLPSWWNEIEKLDYQVTTDLQFKLMEKLQHLGRLAVRWFLRSNRNRNDIAHNVNYFGSHIKKLSLKLDILLEGPLQKQWKKTVHEYTAEGVPEPLARMVSITSYLYILLPIIETAHITEQNTEIVANTYFSIGSTLGLPWYLQKIARLSPQNNWQILAQEAFRDEIDLHIRTITVSILQQCKQDKNAKECMDQWLKEQKSLIDRWNLMLADLRATDTTDYAVYTVANRDLMNLARASALS